MEISFRTSDGTKYFKISHSGSRYYCYKYHSGSVLSHDWDEIGSARTESDAISLVKSYVKDKYGSTSNMKID